MGSSVKRGRPNKTGENQAELTAIFTAPLLLDTASWSSDSIAKFLGTSQSTVARAWKEKFDPSLVTLPKEVPTHGLKLIGVGIFESLSVLICNAPKDNPKSDALPLESFMRSPRRAALQTVLAADLTNQDPKKSVTENILVDFIQSVSAMATDIQEVVIFATQKLPIKSSRPILVTIPSDSWQGLLAHLVQRVTNNSAGSLLDLQQRLMYWNRKSSGPFTWTSKIENYSDDLRVGIANKPKSLNQVVADQVFELIIQQIEAGKLRAGDRITESSLARKLRTTRNQTRDALKYLASSGLVNYQPNRGVEVPQPNLIDVIDIYDARRALGTVIIKRAITNSPAQMATMKKALDEVFEIARTKNTHATGDADLRFQDSIAQSTNMRNIPQMFHLLAAQLRIYISTMGLEYSYSIADICRDDKLIYEKITERKEADAIEAWHAKIDSALDYISKRLVTKR